MKTYIYIAVLFLSSLYSINTLVVRFFTESIIIGAISAIIISSTLFFALKKQIKLLHKVEVVHFIGILCFSVLITIPLIHKMDEENDLEKRTPAPFPEFHLSNVWTFPKGLKAYFNDAFAFRKVLIHQHVQLQTDVFGVSSNPGSVNFGEEGWLFYTPHTYIKQTSKVLTEEELDKIVSNILLKKKFLNDQGIKFYLTIPPIKGQFYKEHLPHRFTQLLKHSILEQLTEHLKKYPEIIFIDLNKVLKKHKPETKLYYETDTHWNRLAAFYAYQEIMKRIQLDFPELDYLEKDEMLIEKHSAKGGDLNSFLGDYNLFTRTVYEMSPKKGFKSFEIVPDSVLAEITYVGTSLVMTKNKNVKSKLKLCIFRDSFTDHLQPFFSESFSRAAFPWQKDINITFVNHEKPDIVVHEILERYIYMMIDRGTEFSAYHQMLKEGTIK